MLTPPLGSISDIFEFENILMAEGENYKKTLFSREKEFGQKISGLVGCTLSFEFSPNYITYNQTGLLQQTVLRPAELLAF